MSWLSKIFGKESRKKIAAAAAQAVLNTDAVGPAVLGAIVSDLMTPERKVVVEAIERKLSLLPLMVKSKDVAGTASTVEDLAADWEMLKATFVRLEMVD